MASSIFSRLASAFPARLFRRITSGGALLAELDGLRAVAILPVVLFHATMSLYLKGAEGQVSAIDPSAAPFHTPLGWLVSQGFLGVQLFFVISGFVVTLPFARARLLGDAAPSLKGFYLKRVTRIEPPYVIALCSYLAGVLLIAPENARIADYLAGLVYLRTALFGSEPWAFFISWSLEIEVQFYLLAPLLATVFWIRSTALRRGILVAAIALTALYAADVRLSASEPPPLGGPLQHGRWLGTEIAFFLIGLLVADLWTLRELRTGDRIASIGYDLGWFAGFVAVVTSYRVLAWHHLGIALLVLGLFLMTLGAFRGNLVRRALSVPVVSVVGGACYTIYLFHFQLVSLFGRFLAPFTTTSLEWNILVLALPFSLVVTAACLALFPLVERPFMHGRWPALVAAAVRTRSLAALAPLFEGPATSSRRSAMPRSGSGG
ncbi:MAG: acyltransferase family protein [Phycisphaera sp.]|nr:acyltransferase family protein [Phycisphaera sp.]